MDFLNKFNFGSHPFLKVTAIVAAVIIGLVVLSVILASLNSARSSLHINNSLNAPGVPGGSSGMRAGDFAVEEMSRSDSISPQPVENLSSGDDSEDFEVKQYNVSIESRNLENDCAVIKDLKTRSEVVFERATESTKRCDYTFKVSSEHTDEIVSILESLNPEDISETAYTIKTQLEDYANEEEILRRQLATIESTLASAERAYDELLELSRETKDAVSLASVIEGKLRIIERLTKESISTSNQLDRLGREKAKQLDRLKYTYFYVSVYEQKYVDGKAISTSWKRATQKFVSDANSSLQDITLNLVSFIFVVIKFSLYILIMLLAVRFGWQVVKKLWKNNEVKTE